MDNIMDLPCGKKSKVVCHRREDLCDLKWPFPSWGKLPRGVVEFQVAPV